MTERKKLILELSNAITEKEWLEYQKIPKLQEKLKKYRLTKAEKEELEIT